MAFVQRNLLKTKKNSGYKGSFVAFNEFVFKLHLKKCLTKYLDRQTEGVNSNYSSVKFEENFTEEN